MIGTTIAHYKITAKLGQGGMGEVYRATDTKLDREVAIKVLPQSFAENKERLARFEREAKTLATLNHPNIAGIYGLEKSGQSQALVLELVEGEDLSERLKRGPLPVEETLEICKQIAEALEAAHEKGIIHRDLKPGNIKITENGKVKVLDFGLAKGMTDEVDSLTSTNDENSPTITDAFTQPGTILGTAAYMSPEQARGKQVDKRTDIWAFGCVLFEYLSGKRAFKGDDVNDTLAAIIRGEPDWNQLPEGVPPSIRRLLDKCLTKDLKRRTPDIAAARIDLEDTLTTPLKLFGLQNDEAYSPRPTTSSAQWLLIFSIATILCIVTAILGWILKPAYGPDLEPIRKFEMSLGLENNLELDTVGATTSFRLSPDGATLAFLVTTAHDNSNQLFIKAPSMLEPKALTSVKNCSDFCFDPTGEWIAFRDRTDYQIKKARVDGGPAVALNQAKEPVFGMSWGEGEWIAIGQASGCIKGISAVQAGNSIELTTLENGDRAHRWPYFLPGGKALLFSSGRTGGPVSQLKSQRIPSGTAQPLRIDGRPIRGHHPYYLTGGQLVYAESDIQGTKLYGVGFDIASLQPNGNRSILIDQIDEKWPDMTRFDVSNGTLVYLSKTDPVMAELYWVDRQGNQELALPADARFNHRISPNGQFVAFFNHQNHLMIYDLKSFVVKNPLFQ
ncbi:MAG: protein kinase [Verrucomicrobiota bacterium]